MSHKHRVLVVVFIFIISTMLISACTQSLSTASAETPTVIPTGLFVSPFPSVENPMAMIEEFARQTSVAQTTVASGGIPAEPLSTSVALTPPAETAVPTSTPPSTPTNVVATPVVQSGSTATPVTPAAPITPGVRPKDYVLQAGEFPYCIARRFDVDPDALLSASGLTSPDLYYAGLKLIIPQSGAFPGGGALAAHPTTYTVLSGDETLYSIACKFGNVYPQSIADKNAIAVSAKLTAGQKLEIP